MAAKYSLKVGSRSIPLVTSRDKINLQQISEFKPLQDWAKGLEKEEADAAKSSSKEPSVVVSKVEVNNVEYFGSSKVGFVNLSVDAKLTESGQKPPGLIFMRGGAVAVLLILRSKQPSTGAISEHVVLTNQPRLSIPSFDFPEIPAGMLDGSGDFVGKCAEELKEECGITLENDSLVDMTQLAYGSNWKGVYPSAGGCDEFLRLFVSRKDMDWEELQGLKGRLGGLRDHGESISLSIVGLREAYKAAPDAKLLSSLALYDALKADGKIE
ncbi:ADP-sugar diphosphatase [Entomortierella parvispora]|uniref:ADP-sugar diphosphatase n=1 Tax=Entomortierella parvispora TaxID=205924 RepID=A0A9P3HF49_9FUNG|nr:ADP-sugar diphosphatase [Entomortierella parvispora]